MAVQGVTYVGSDKEWAAAVERELADLRKLAEQALSIAKSK